MDTCYLSLLRFIPRFLFVLSGRIWEANDLSSVFLLLFVLSPKSLVPALSGDGWLVAYDEERDASKTLQ